MADPEEYMLTTIDNPWNPFTNWKEWYAYDMTMGYDTPGYLARICQFSFELSDADQEQAIRDAIDEIVEVNIRGLYRKIRANDTVVLARTGGGSSENTPPLASPNP